MTGRALIDGVTYRDPESGQEAIKARKDLEEYCGLDTQAMIWIVDELEKLSAVIE